MWWGGQCPPARFLVPLVPVLGVCAALRADSASPIQGLARWRFVLAALGLAIAVFAVARPGDLLLLNRGDRPTRLWTALSGDAEVGRYLPSLVTASPEEDRVAMVWVAVLAALFALDAAARRAPRADRLFTGTGLPLVLLLAAGAGVDYWARRGGQSTPAPEVKILTSFDPAMSGAIGNVGLDGVEPARLVTHLWERRRIIVTPIVHEEFRGIRVTPNVYTTLGEVDAFAEEMERVIARGLTA